MHAHNIILISNNCLLFQFRLVLLQLLEIGLCVSSVTSQQIEDVCASLSCCYRTLASHLDFQFLLLRYNYSC